MLKYMRGKKMEQKFQFHGKSYDFSEMCIVVGKALEEKVKSFKEMKEVLVKLKQDLRFCSISKGSDSHVKAVLKKYNRLMALTDEHAVESIKKMKKCLYTENYPLILEGIEKDLDRHNDMLLTLNRHLHKYIIEVVDKRIVEVALEHDLMIIDISLKTLDMQKEFISGEAKECEHIM